MAAGSKVTVAYLDGVERYVAGVTQAERKFGEQSQIEVYRRRCSTRTPS